VGIDEPGDGECHRSRRLKPGGCDGFSDRGSRRNFAHCHLGVGQRIHPEQRPRESRIQNLPQQPRRGLLRRVGCQRWPAAHAEDVGLLYRLVLDKGVAGASYHAVHEEGVPLRQIAEAIGRGLKIPVVSQTPEQAAAHFGFLAHFVGADIPASSKLTHLRLGWNPTDVGMIADLNNMDHNQPSMTVVRGQGSRK
jgi:hypothetical protein